MYNDEDPRRYSVYFTDTQIPTGVGSRLSRIPRTPYRKGTSKLGTVIHSTSFDEAASFTGMNWRQQTKEGNQPKVVVKCVRATHQRERSILVL